jgi:hypothetical protein
MPHGATEPPMASMMALRTVMETMMPATAPVLKLFLVKHNSLSPI